MTHFWISLPFIGCNLQGITIWRRQKLYCDQKNSDGYSSRWSLSWADRRFMVVDWIFSYILWGIEYGCSAHFAAFKPPKTAESHWNSKLHLMPHIFHCLSKWKQEPAFLIWEIFSRENLSPGIKTLPKAQRTRGLSSSWQSNFWGHITSSNTNLDHISSSESRLSIN